MDPYDEDVELDKYVLGHCFDLMTPFEFIGQGGAGVARDHAGELVRKAIHARWAEGNDPAVIAAYWQSLEAFRRAVRERVIRDGGVKGLINRCPRCQRILRTPLAKICYWCGHSSKAVS